MYRLHIFLSLSQSLSSMDHRRNKAMAKTRRFDEILLTLLAFLFPLFSLLCHCVYKVTFKSFFFFLVVVVPLFLMNDRRRGRTG